MCVCTKWMDSRHLSTQKILYLSSGSRVRYQRGHPPPPPVKDPFGTFGTQYLTFFLNILPSFCSAYFCFMFNCFFIILFQFFPAPLLLTYSSSVDSYHQPDKYCVQLMVTFPWQDHPALSNTIR